MLGEYDYCVVVELFDYINFGFLFKQFGGFVVVVGLDVVSVNCFSCECKVLYFEVISLLVCKLQVIEEYVYDYFVLVLF